MEAGDQHCQLRWSAAAFRCEAVGAGKRIATCLRLAEPEANSYLQLSAAAFRCEAVGAGKRIATCLRLAEPEANSYLQLSAAAFRCEAVGAGKRIAACLRLAEPEANSYLQLSAAAFRRKQWEQGRETAINTMTRRCARSGAAAPYHRALCRTPSVAAGLRPVRTGTCRNSPGA